MLLALVTGQRVQTLNLLRLENLRVENYGFVFLVTDVLKQSSPYRKNPIIKLLPYEDEDLCAAKVLKYYLMRTMKIRNGESKLLISYVKPHKSVSRDTISRWIKRVLFQSGVDGKKCKKY